MRISDWSSDVCSSDLGAESILTPCDIGRKYCCAKSEAAPHDAGRSAGRSLRAGSFRGRRMDFDACRSLTAAFFEQVSRRRDAQIGRAHVCTPVTNAQLVCRLLIEKKNTTAHTIR